MFQPALTMLLKQIINVEHTDLLGQLKMPETTMRYDKLLRFVCCLNILFVGVVADLWPAVNGTVILYVATWERCVQCRNPREVTIDPQNTFLHKAPLFLLSYNRINMFIGLLDCCVKPVASVRCCKLQTVTKLILCCHPSGLFARPSDWLWNSDVIPRKYYSHFSWRNN